MKISFICSRYNDPDPEVRRRNLREHDALCRWAMAHGYAPVSPFAGVDRDNPPDDAEGGREAALARSQALAAMVGAAGGTLIMPGWYQQTRGMEIDCEAFRAAGQGPEHGRWGLVKLVKETEVIDE